jgi:hypothetical protein
MTYEEFKDYITSKCLYDAIYEDQEGREIIVMTVLDAYSMASKLAKREWVGLADEEIEGLWKSRVSWTNNNFSRAVEHLLKEKNT